MRPPCHRVIATSRARRFTARSDVSKPRNANQFLEDQIRALLHDASYSLKPRVHSTVADAAAEQSF